MTTRSERADIVMLGTFSAWRLGTLQARALPIARELSRRGLRVTIITTPWDEQHEAGVRDVIGGVHLINTRYVSLRFAPLAIKEQVLRTRSLTPNLVHVFKPRGFGGFAGQLLQHEYPLVVDSDDWEGDGGWSRLRSYPAPMRRVFDWQERTLIRTAKAVTAASALLETRARRMRTASAPGAVVRVPNGLEENWLSALSPSASRDPSAIPATVLIYSRFEEIGPGWLRQFIKAVASLSPNPIRVVVVGPSELSVGGVGSVSVELLGYVARHELPALLAVATVAVLPLDDSLVSRSKQSVKLLELMASGCPVIASDVGDVAATLTDAGTTVSGSESLDFARAACRLLENPAVLANMSCSGPARVRQRFHIETVAEHVLTAYRRAGFTIP